MEPTEKIAIFVSTFNFNDIPQNGVEAVKEAILDYVGVTLSGYFEKCSEIVRKIVITMGGNAQATIWGTKIKSSVILATLANGTAAHALDYDDVNTIMRSHPSIQLLPALFSLMEYEHRDGKELIEAYVAGFEVGTILGRVLNPNLVLNGWFPVGTLGTLMQTVACSKLLDLDANQIKMSLGIAANLASGLRCNNGTMAKPLMAGQVGCNGILATLLAREGMTADRQALENRFGFFENFTHGDLGGLQDAVGSLGERMDIVESGISHKLYPSCAGTHMAIESALNIVGERPINIEEIENIVVKISSHAKYPLIHPRPHTELEAKFSLEYCVARAIIDGEMGPSQFTPEKIVDPKIINLIEKIKPEYFDPPHDESVGNWYRFPVTINVYLKNGTMLTSRVDHIKGSQENPITTTDLESKFHNCCLKKMPTMNIDQVMKFIRNFEEVKDLNNLINMMSGA